MNIFGLLIFRNIWMKKNIRVNKRHCRCWNFAWLFARKGKNILKLKCLFTNYVQSKGFCYIIWPVLQFSPFFLLAHFVMRYQLFYGSIDSLPQIGSLIIWNVCLILSNYIRRKDVSHVIIDFISNRFFFLTILRTDTIRTIYFYHSTRWLLRRSPNVL